MPTNKLYVGQTINSAYSRLKCHWQTRFTDDFRNSGLHSIMRASASINEYLIWPLEHIEPAVYTFRDTIYRNNFRAFASYRERYWIIKLRTLNPRGFNIQLPIINKDFCRRTPEPPLTIQDAYTVATTDKSFIDTKSSGPTLRLRTLYNQLLSTPKDTDLQLHLKQLSKHLRMQLLQWSYTQIPVAHLDNQVVKIQTIIRDINKKPSAIPKDKKSPTTLIKVVHIHEAIQYANIRSVIRTPSISKLLPGNNGTKEDSVPMICDKQTLPYSTVLCNFSKASKSIDSSHSLMPPVSTCPCRNILLPSCPDLVDGHIMSTNYDYLRNEELRRQFYYGSVFKDNIDKDSILESIELGLSDYINKISQPPTQLTNIEMDNLEEWKRSILHRC